MSWRRAIIRFGAWAAFLLIVAVSLPAKAAGGCQPVAVGPNTPTGAMGCVLYGHGVASRWSGPGVARNDCLYPWTRCTPITITSLQTGRSITVVPRMYCDCWIGTPDQRIVDLDPAAVAALGLDPSAGLYPVDVQPAVVVPDTSIR